MCEDLREDKAFIMVFNHKMIRKLRSDLELTKTGLAKLTGIDLSYVARIESGMNSPTANTLCKLADALEVEDMNVFFTVSTE